MNKVEKKYISVAVNRSGLVLYAKDVAINFIKDCEEEDVLVLGIDGFYLSDEETEPSIENSVDFSSKSFVGNVYEQARSYLERAPQELFFEIICEE